MTAIRRKLSDWTCTDGPLPQYAVPDARLIASFYIDGVIDPGAVTVANWIVYWRGWPTPWRTGKGTCYWHMGLEAWVIDQNWTSEFRPFGFSGRFYLMPYGRMPVFVSSLSPP